MGRTRAGRKHGESRANIPEQEVGQGCPRDSNPRRGRESKDDNRQPKEPLGYSRPTAASCLHTPQGLSATIPASEAGPGPCPPHCWPGRPRARLR